MDTITIAEDRRQKVKLVRDPRGETDTYEAFSLLCTSQGRVVWTEGVKKDRSDMYPEWRAIVEPALNAIKGAA